MAKDLTKYSVAGIANGLGKARLVQKVVEDYSAKMKMSFSDLQEVWFDDLQGGKGVIRSQRSGTRTPPSETGGGGGGRVGETELGKHNSTWRVDRGSCNSPVYLTA